ncbi:putative spermidine/putrescine transport system permease protein [Pasteurella testudinis DSM 23072]|uniref:Putative spermidine/putrescine transport system permease protein n=1 Tax=Pasteurella testudinis DSM 23072 TaxID=1122938 RepID=A0A1W1UE93_9PAST|nr:ABC transporter permease subunit [Pasteurella testudinis]SMB79353.1 putative spermidine/putrescine transport system permease protein [Pasteurella testudinis DSM 23072]SUB50791.1 Fe(3+) transport system permease protein AfuB-1 [Pasteurella testudinis]
MKGKWLAVSVTLPFLLFFFAFQIVPLIWIVLNSFQIEDGGWGLQNFSEILNSSFYLQAIRYSLEIAIWSSLFGLVIALFGSYSLSAVRPSRIGDFILSFNSMTSNFSGIPLAFAFIILLGANGAVNLLLRHYQFETIDIYSKVGIIIIYTYFQIPLAVLLLYPAFEGLKKEWQEAAALLGANVAAYWCRIAVPVLMPALLGTLVILFANAIGAYATIYALTSGNFNVVPIRIGALVSGDIFLNPYLASALSLFLIGLMLLVTVIHRWLSKRYNYQDKG